MGKNILKAAWLHIMVRYLGIIVFGFSLFAGVTAPKKPNILFISVDDLRDWVGFMGGYKGKVHTPHMDELASRGTAFLNAHTAAPVCCPSRAAVMSGLLPSTSGIYNNGHWWKPNLPELVTLRSVRGKSFITLPETIRRPFGMNTIVLSLTMMPFRAAPVVT